MAYRKKNFCFIQKASVHEAYQNPMILIKRIILYFLKAPVTTNKSTAEQTDLFSLDITPIVGGHIPVTAGIIYIFRLLLLHETFK